MLIIQWLVLSIAVSVTAAVVPGLFIKGEISGD